MAEMTEFYERIKWVILLISKLCHHKFSGTLILDFHEGNLSRKYKRQVTELAPD